MARPASQTGTPSVEKGTFNSLSRDEKHHEISNPTIHSELYGQETLTIDHVAENKLVRNLDLHIVPLVTLLYLIAFLDRVNIGNARLYGMESDLSLTGDRYQTAVSLLFVTYLIFEVPSNLVLKHFHPSRWIASICIAWGIIATCTGLCQTYGGLLACRLLLGAAESGLFPGMTIYLTFFYTKRELALRVGYLFVSAALAGACGGLLAYGIGFMEGIQGLNGWRWIMILEGIPSVILGVVVWFWMADKPETAYYLTEEERALMVVRKQRQLGYTVSSDELHKKDVLMAFKDWKVWAICVGQFGMDTMLYGFSTFLPTIIKDLGKWDTAQTQALTVPCYVLGAVTYLVVAHFSDKQQRRGVYACVFGMVSVIGYGILISESASGVKYFGCFLVAMGLYVAVGIPLSWMPTNQPRYGKRTTATGMQLTIGNSGGVLAPFIYKTSEAPRYVRGHAITLSLVGAASVLYACLSLYLVRKNRKRKEGMEDGKIVGMSEEEIMELGDENPRYMYTY